MAKVRGVYEHPKGSQIWWCQYFIDGRRFRERAGTKTDAGKLYRKRKTEALTGDKLPELRRKRVSFGELIDDAVAFARIHNKSAHKTAEKGALVRPHFGTLNADSIKPEQISAWIDRRGCSNATFNRYKAFFSLCFREGMRAGKVAANPARLVRRRAEPSGRKRFLSRKEFESLLQKIDKPARRRGFVVSVFTGMRLSEQYTLEWSQVDFERNEINLTGTKNGSDRSIPMVRQVREALAAEHARLTDLDKEPAGNALVFVRTRGGRKPVQPRWFTKLAADSGISGYTWHNNRHTFCSWLAINGTPLKTIQELAGHKTITMTARYAHLSPDHRTAEMDRMASDQPRTATKTAIDSKRRKRSA